MSANQGVTKVKIPPNEIHEHVARSLWTLLYELRGFAERYPGLYGDNAGVVFAELGPGLRTSGDALPKENVYSHVQAALLLALTEVCWGDPDEAKMGLEALMVRAENRYRPHAAFRAMVAMPDRRGDGDRASYAWIVDVDYRQEHNPVGMVGAMAPEPATMDYDLWCQLVTDNQGLRWRAFGANDEPVCAGRIVSTEDRVPLFEIPDLGGPVEYWNDEAGEWKRA